MATHKHIQEKLTRKTDYLRELRTKQLKKQYITRHFVKLFFDKVVQFLKWSTTDKQKSISFRGNKEYWWNVPLKTASKSKHNRPDILILDKELKVCSVIEISCPADVNISSEVTEKENIYSNTPKSLRSFGHRD